MPVAKTSEFLAVLRDPSATLEALGFDDGRFCLMAHLGDGPLIHANNDGSIKHYGHAEDIFRWLRWATGRSKVVVNLANWQPRPHRKRR